LGPDHKEGETLMAVTDRQPQATPSEVADHLRIPEHTLAQWRSRGQGPRYRRVGRHVRYDWRDIERWLEEQSRGGEAA
jgi:hypothetical protein